jgi:hypothetical protein
MLIGSAKLEQVGDDLEKLAKWCEEEMHSCFEGDVKIFCY